MTTGEKIKRIRQHRKMAQKELGDAVGLPANRIAQYEMGYRVPKTALLEKMAEALAVARESLLENNGMAVAMLEQLRTIDKSRLKSYVGRLSDKTMKKIDDALSISVGANLHRNEETR